MDLKLQMTMLRLARNQRLNDSDWTQGADASRRLTAEKIAAWADYRQALCDLPETYPNPADWVWPTPPT
jgi:hypothetical protein